MVWVVNKEWTKIEKIHALGSRRYQINKTAEWGHLSFECNELDYAFEVGLIIAYSIDITEKGSSPLSEEDRNNISEWVIKTSNDWLLQKAKEENIEVKMCEGGCGRITGKDEQGRFLCVCRYDGHG